MLPSRCQFLIASQRRTLAFLPFHHTFRSGRTILPGITRVPDCLSCRHASCTPKSIGLHNRGQLSQIGNRWKSSHICTGYSHLCSCGRVCLSLDYSEHVRRRLPDSHSCIHLQLCMSLQSSQYSLFMARKRSLYDAMARPV